MTCWKDAPRKGRARTGGSHEYGVGFRFSPGAGTAVCSSRRAGAAGPANAVDVLPLADSFLALCVVAAGGWAAVIAGIVANAGERFQSGASVAETQHCAGGSDRPRSPRTV